MERPLVSKSKNIPERLKHEIDNAIKEAAGFTPELRKLITSKILSSLQKKLGGQTVFIPEED